MTQSEMVLEWLKEKGELDPVTALKELGTFRLAARIQELRNRGYIIATRMNTYTNWKGQKKRFAVYSLADTDIAVGDE